MRQLEEGWGTYLERPEQFRLLRFSDLEHLTRRLHELISNDSINC